MAEPNTTCQHCGKPFHVRPSVLARGAGKFCSWECARLGGRRKSGPGHHSWKGGPRVTAERQALKRLVCVGCDAEFYARKARKYCVPACYHRNKPRTGPRVGLRRITSKGYVEITQADGRRLKEHRLMWEQAHGSIPDGYVVHHINRDRADNRLENLELMSWGQHTARHNREDQRQVARVPDCHPDRKHAARGLCAMCYQREFRAKRSTS